MTQSAWERLRYRGDAADVKALYETYRVEEYLQTVEETRRAAEFGPREMLLKDGVRLSDRISPRIFEVFGSVEKALGLELGAEVFCVPSPEVNAFAVLDEKQDSARFLVGVTSGALEKLEDGELRFILGHELGHIVLGNNRLKGLENPNPSNPAATVLPPLGESLYLRWQKKAEVSVDRIGLVACGDFPTAARSLLKATFGLTERNLNLDVESLLAQIDELRGKGVLMFEAFASHPLLPIRLKALELFSRSAKARSAGFPGHGPVLVDDELEAQVDALMALTRRHPTDPLDVALMEALALGGALVLSSDGEVSSDEVKLLIQMLHGTFTDEPEAVIVTDRREIRRRLPAVAKTIVESGNERAKGYLLSRLAELALADGALLDAEGTAILEIGEMLEVPGRAIHPLMVSAAQANGFGTDARLSQITENLRKSLKDGLRSGERDWRHQRRVLRGQAARLP